MEMQKIEEELLKLQDQMISSIQQCIQIESIKGEPVERAPYGNGPKKALEFALQLGKELGLSTYNVNNRSGYVEIGNGEEMTGILGHLDVVPAGDGWKYPPFGGVIENGTLYGRGVMDDKGPTIGAIYGLKAIQNAKVKLKRRIRVIFGTDEECGASCMRDYIKSGQELPKIGFTPDAEFPLIFSEKGISNYRVSTSITDISNCPVISLEGGTAGNIVPNECRIIINKKIQVNKLHGIDVIQNEHVTEIKAKGESAHGSTPELGRNAIVLLMKAIKGADLGKEFNTLRDFILTYLAEDTDGTALGICYEEKDTGKTTVNLGLITYKNNIFSISLDIRYPINASEQIIEDRIKYLAVNGHLSAIKLNSVPNLYVPKDSEVVTKLMKVYKNMTGRSEEPLAIGGGTYAKEFKNMVAFGPVFPGDTVAIHAADESISVARLLESIGIITAAMYELSR